MFAELKLFTKLFFMIIVVFSIILYFFAIVLGPFLFYFTEGGIAASLTHLSSLPIWILNVTTRIPIGFDIGLIFFVLWVVFTSSFIVSWKLEKNLH